MRITILHYAAPPVVGGVERVIYHHATLLARAGHAVRVVAGRGAPFDPAVAFERVPWVDSRHPEILALKRALDEGAFPAAQFERMAARIGEALQPSIETADVLIAHNVLSLHKSLPLTAALRRVAEAGAGPRLIAWHHDLAWKAARYRSEMHDGYPWDLLRERWPNTRHVAVSEARRRDVMEVFGLAAEEVTVVRNGLDTSAFLKLEPPIHALFFEDGLADAAPLLLLPARITRRKNIELAIRAVAALRAGAMPAAALVVTGPPGPHNPDNLGYYGELKALAAALGVEGAIHFLTERMGRDLRYEEVADLYRLADALLFPSHEEGFGLPVLEAALTRLPIFCADIPALRELAGGQAHMFAPAAAPEHVADLIRAVLSDDRATAFRRRVFAHYDWHHIVRNQIEPLLG
ncbi:MAG: glycosyltransferase family 4 protein [Anaerolineae bacterium]